MASLRASGTINHNLSLKKLEFSFCEYKFDGPLNVQLTLNEFTIPISTLLTTNSLSQAAALLQEKVSICEPNNAATLYGNNSKSMTTIIRLPSDLVVH